LFEFETNVRFVNSLPHNPPPKYMMIFTSIIYLYRRRFESAPLLGAIFKSVTGINLQRFNYSTVYTTTLMCPFTLASIIPRITTVQLTNARRFQITRIFLLFPSQSLRSGCIIDCRHRDTVCPQIGV